jgi:hypothetical protein
MTLIQVGSQSNRTLAPIHRRALFILLEVFGGTVGLQLLRAMKRVLIRCVKESQEWKAYRPWLLLLVNLLVKSLASVGSLHKAFAFAFHSRHYSLSMRLAGISYLTLRPQSNTGVSHNQIT